MKRRHVLTSLAALCAAPAHAQAERPLTLVVPYAPGGGTDALARLLAAQLAPLLGRAVLVENQPGAGSTLGATRVARAAPDGHTALMATSSTLAIAPALYPALAYDPQRDFEPVGLVAAVPFVLVVPPAPGVRSVAELLALSRSSGGLAYGSAGIGSPQHLAAALFAAATGAGWRHVPYGGSAAAITDLLGGRLDLMFADLAVAAPHVQAGRLTALGVTSAQPQARLPDVAPLAQAGLAALAGFDVTAWQGLVLPAGVPAARIEPLRLALAHTLQQPALLEALQSLGMQPRWEAAAQMATTVRAETARWARLIREARITAD